MTIIPKFISHAVEKVHTIFLIKSSHLFDKKWYSDKYLYDMKVKSPINHYLKHGYRLGYDPSEKFSTSRYLETYPEVKEEMINPLVHYLKKGKKMGYQIFAHITEEEKDSKWLEEKKPFLSIIVPNYNHQAFLQKRLDTIYNQNYKNYEVILLDDLSTDDSVTILREYAEKYSDRTKLILNETNSGSPFAQWKKGISEAKGDFIWIAESDDWCDLDFTEKLLPKFRDEAVMLSFSRTDFMTNDTKTWTIEEYLHDIGGKKYDHSHKISAHECVKNYFSKKNIIPNVSSCIFRRPLDFPLFNDNQWNHMKVCGDWIFYLYLIRGGYIYYTTKTTNYYRQHQSNTSVGLHSKDLYYQEHQIVRKYLAKLYNIDSEGLNWMVSHLRNFWKQNRNDYSDEIFNQIFCNEEIIEEKSNRLPNLAICCYAFSTGGGEKVPIDQANALKEAGLAITFIDCSGTTRNEAIRKKLRNDIPVISIGWDFSIIKHLFKELGIEYAHTHHASVDCGIAENKPDHVKQIVTLHGMYETIPERYLKVQIPMLLKKVHQWLYIAEKNLSIMVEYGANRDMFKKVFNAVPSTPIERTRKEIIKECGFRDDSIIAAIASRALPEKGWKSAYESIQRTRKATGKDICVIFIGDGPLYESMKKDKNEWAYFAGYSNDVASFFNTADFVLLPSTYSGESFPLCILEAFQAGKPVIATNIGEIPNMVETTDGNAGIIIPIKNNEVDSESLDSAIKEYSEKNTIYKDACHCATIAAEKYSMHNLTNLLIKYYKE